MRRLPRRAQGFWARLLTGVVMLVSGVVLCALSLVMVGVFAIFGGALWLWAVWRTRDLRRALREQSLHGAARSTETGGAVIEGEYVEIAQRTPDKPRRRR
jgi:ABC-type bacteriocin/lantibiotic exporter with double-glycine peptidase domain